MSSRRPGYRLNRGRVAGGPSGAWTPARISGVAAVWLAEDLSGTGDGNAVTGNWIDRVNGYTLAPLLTDQGTYRAAYFREGSQKACLEQSNKAGKSVDAALVALLSGTNKTYTVVTLSALKSNGTNCYWSAGAAADAQHFVTCQFAAGTTRKNQMTTRFGATAATIDSASEFQAQAPQLIEWTRAGSSWSFVKDGIQEGSFTRSDTGLTSNQFLVGASSAGAGTVAASTQYLSAVIVVAGAISAADLTQLRVWAADRLGMQWKKGLTGGLWTGTSYVIFGEAQSNGLLESRGNAPYTALTAPRAYALGHDLMLHTADDPQGINTNNSYTSFSHSGTGSAGPALANALYSGGLYGANDALINAGFAVGGVTSTQWNTNTTTSPPTANDLLGVTKLRWIELMRNLPNPQILINIIYQGESDTGSDANVAIWATDWTAIANEVINFASTMGWTWAKATTRHLLEILPAANWSAATALRWSTLITNMQAWVAGRVDTISNQSPSGPYIDGATQLHLDTPAHAVIAGAQATLILAAA